ncbi:MAG: FKBP-type peptidyl-prolyl cis-trans isomerase [Chlamydiales bacterium]|nr:FKBP-type peptidyl-prolyl cis-trans isomerase [Chlamydiales bacterium]
MLRYFITCFLIVRTACFGQIHDLSVEQETVLSTFVKTLLKDSEAGYVVLGQKPVCVEAYFSKDPLPVNSSAHKQSTALRAGAKIWKDLADSPSDTIIHVCDKEDPQLPRYIHLLVINKPLFYKVVDENLPLFQYVLGPAVTSQTLLDELLSNHQTIYSLLKGNKVLIGIVLGYGPQNSLYVGRKENIQEAMEEEVPPFLANTLVKQEFNQEFLPFSPTFGFTSVADEINNFEQQTTTSSPKLITESPQFIFGWVKNSENSKKIISQLEASQDVINRSLLYSSSLEQTLQQFGKKKHTSKKTTPNSAAISEDIDELMARAIWEVVQDYDSDYFPYVVEGMQTMKYQGKVDRLARFPDYRRTFLQAKANLQEADRLFVRLNQDTSFVSSIPSKVAFRTLKNGHGETKCQGCYVSLSYSIFSPLDQVLATEKNVMVNLKNTIPGFAAGIKGMRIGETREVHIHPSLAYGFDTSLDKCISLRAVVQLHDIKDNSEFDLKVSQLDLDFINSDDQLKTVENNYKNAIIERSVDLARYLKKSDKLNLSKIIKHLRSLHDSGDVKYPLLTEEQRNLVNQVHWDIYFTVLPFKS